MVRHTEAIFKNGMLQPTEKLDLREDERVRITIEPISLSSDDRREPALQRVLKGQAETKFKSTGRYPTRDELHERN